MIISVKSINYSILFVLLSWMIVVSCEKERYPVTGDAKLAFSTDTVMFDTIFTTFGSTTQAFKVINPSANEVEISSIALAGGDQSFYRLNIDGEMVNEARNISLRGLDSMYIFVEVTIDPNGVDQPMVVKDSVVFTVGGVTQDVDLVAYGQDVILLDGVISKPRTLLPGKPFLVFNSLVVNKNQQLTIQPGVKIHFHKDAFCWVEGAINAVGTVDDPVVFEGDRLEKMYSDVPSQWQGIILSPGRMGSKFENVIIKNAVIGLQVGMLEVDGYANAKLHNVRIENMSYAGLFCIGSNVQATNVLVGDCGFYGITALVEGNYSFTHCTVANYWGSLTHRSTPAVLISNSIIDGDSTYYGNIQARWENSVISGDINGSEVILGNNPGYDFDVSFDHCYVKVSDSVYDANSSLFQSLMRNRDTLFTDVREYNYMPDSLSPLRGFGARNFAEKVPSDLANTSRLSDDGPDIGAYEYIYIEKKEE